MTNSTKPAKIKKQPKASRVTRAKKGTQEFFTPEFIIEVMLENTPSKFFKDLEIFHESCCGNGNILVKIYNRYREFHDHETALSVVYGFDFMPDNVVEAITRLYGPGEIKKLDTIPTDMVQPGLIAVFTHNGRVVKNIVCADGLEYKKNYGLSLIAETFGPNKLFELAS